VTNAASLYIQDAPLAGTNTTITNSYALLVDAGKSRFDEKIILAGSTGNSRIACTNANAFLDLDNSAGVTTISGQQLALIGAAGIYTGTNNNIIVQGGGIGLGATPTAVLHCQQNRNASNWGLNGINLRCNAQTFTDTSTAALGTATNNVINAIAQPTINSTNFGVTTTNSATLYIADAPLQGSNMTLLNRFALWVDAGETRLDGKLTIPSLNITPTYGSGEFRIEPDTYMTEFRVRDSSGVTHPKMTIFGVSSTDAPNGPVYVQTGTGGLRVEDRLRIGSVEDNPAASLHVATDVAAPLWGFNGVQARFDAKTFTENLVGSTTVASAVLNSFAQSTIDSLNSGLVYTDVATVYIADAPSAGSNVTFTNKYPLWIGAGTTRMDGGLIITPGGTAPSLSVNGQITFELTNDTTLTIKARGSDGVTRSGTIALS
jgi:hypothetical protein